jgi:NitT/TauT family transport system substrate-binding protein
MIRKFAIFATIALLGISSFGQLPKLTFTPHWLPQAQFAGYYVADKMGFYRAEGIDVEIVHPSASVNATENLINGKSDIISLFLISAISLKSSGVD